MNPEVPPCKKFDVVEVDWEFATFEEQEFFMCDVMKIPYPQKLSVSPGGQTFPPPLIVFTKYVVKLKKEFTREGGIAGWKTPQIKSC